jgi:leucyl aminopeptidase
LGRLVLADALHYAMSLNPAYVIDLATLTGACMVGLGPYTTGMFCNNEVMAATLKESADCMGEDFWRLPLTEKLHEELKSDVADMKNTGSRLGGAITAALFLSYFVAEGINWAHLDIAGPSTSNTESGALSKGGTGVGVSTLVDFILKHQA